MSSYTILHIVPIDSPEWIPDQEFMMEVLAHLGATQVWHATGYSVPDYWDSEETEQEENVVFYRLDWRTDLASAFDLWQQCRPVCTSISFFAHGTIDVIIESLLTIPESIRGTTVVDALSLGIGPFSIPSIVWETTIGRFCFEFAIHGQGMPFEYEQYVQAVREDPEIKKLLSYLEEKSGKQWDVLVSCSY